jgi:hypothetical protein
MKPQFTNNYNLPDIIVKVITKDRYTVEGEEPSDFSASSLIAPTQQTVLLKRHSSDHIIRDVVDEVWKFFGSITHQVLEDAYNEHLKVEGDLVEVRLYIDVEGKVVSGKNDQYSGKKITDYKTTKAYKIMKGDFSDWEKQLNIYAEILEQNGYEVEEVEILAMVSDWKKGEVYKKNYPPTPFLTIPIELWPKEKRMEYIKDRVVRSKICQKLTDEEIADQYPCSEHEMWQSLKDYAIWKDGGKKALKCFDNAIDANNHMDEKQLGPEYKIIRRMTERRRCIDFCDIAHKCIQNKKLYAEEGKVWPYDDVEQVKPLF